MVTGHCALEPVETKISIAAIQSGDACPGNKR
jgi:hypothetical protein